MDFFLWMALSVGLTPMPGPVEDSVYVYDVFKPGTACAEMEERLKALPLRSTVILSIEQGPEFVLDRPKGEDDLACVLNHLRAASRKVKVLLLQDPVFLDRGEEAVRRAALVSAFAERHKGQLAGVQVDVEPYTIEKWGCCNAEERRAILRDLHQLLTRVRRNLGGLPLAVVAPWWYPVVRELPEAGPELMFQVVDEIYLMAYGDEGGPLVGGTAERVLGRVDAPEFFTGKGRMYIALAAYEFRSPEHLQAELETVRRRLASRPTFAGTALFHATSAFNVPLGRFVSGTVIDPDGKRLAGVEVQADGATAKTNVCGQFSLRLPGTSTKAELVLRKPGFLARKLQPDLPMPGSTRELGNITLEKEKEAAP